LPITTVFLDAGGVLVVPNWQRISDTLAAHGVNATPGALEAADPLARHELDLALTTNATDQQRGWHYFNLVLRHAGLDLSPAALAALAELQAYHADQNLWEQIPDGVPEALDALRAAGMKLVVVSNANGRLKFLMERLGLAGRVDVMFDSFEEGVEKPDPRLFQIAMERSGAVAEETVHVGDLYYVDVAGARAAGLRGVLLDPQNLYDGFDCERIQSLGELPGRL
jgi:HAD superfamily hydrolase (TIGR01549 family)